MGGTGWDPGPQDCALLCAGLSSGEALDRLTPENFPDLSQDFAMTISFLRILYSDTVSVLSLRGKHCLKASRGGDVCFILFSGTCGSFPFEYTDVSLGSITMLSYCISPRHSTYESISHVRTCLFTAPGSL